MYTSYNILSILWR